MQNMKMGLLTFKTDKLRYVDTSPLTFSPP